MFKCKLKKALNNNTILNNICLLDILIVFFLVLQNSKNSITYFSVLLFLCFLHQWINQFHLVYPLFCLTRLVCVLCSIMFRYIIMLPFVQMENKSWPRPLISLWRSRCPTPWVTFRGFNLNTIGRSYDGDGTIMWWWWYDHMMMMVRPCDDYGTIIWWWWYDHMMMMVRSYVYDGGTIRVWWGDLMMMMMGGSYDDDGGIIWWGDHRGMMVRS